MSKVEALEYGSSSIATQSSNKKYIIIGGIVVGVCVIALVIGLSVGLTQNKNEESTTTLSPTTVTSTPPLKDDRRIDCYPEASSPQEHVDQARCEARGCIFSPSETTPSAPACFWPPDGENAGLRVLSEEQLSTGKRWRLQIKQGSMVFASEITTLNFTVTELSDEMLQFKFEDALNPDRYQVPLTLNKPETPISSAKRYHYEVQEDPFSFKVIRTDTNAVIFDTSAGGLIFTDQLLQISTLLPTINVYGFGENIHTTLRHDLNYRTWPLFARDQPPGDNENPLYSVHPFYECVEADGKTHGVLLMNSNAMEYGFTPAPMLTYRTIGGILDFYVMLGPSPENVIRQYTGLVGRPYMPPYWALGFQLSRFGYRNTSEMREAVNRTLSYSIPLDVQHADIDHMQARRDFTIDQINFGDLPEYFTELQSGGIKTIIILDPCFEINDTYAPYLKGREADIYIKWSSMEAMPPAEYAEYNRTDMMGYVWPNWKSVFPDFFNSKTDAVWSELIVDHHKNLSFDGIWIDMNEPANFDTNNDKIWNWIHGPPYWSLKCPNSTWDDPPYRPKAVHTFDNNDKKIRMADKTLCMEALLADGTLRHYDVHNLYGHVQAKSTLSAMRNALPSTKRGMLLTRSTFIGSGQYAGRWLGDNSATWKDLRDSVIGIQEFNLFGIPYIGADICGFFNNPSTELCKRWMQLGAFYTFSRNHNHEGAEAQDPGILGEEVAVASRQALETRYRLLPYLYTLFHKAHSQGDTVIRPLFHEFPKEESALNSNTQFLWGPALLISPILQEKQDTIEIHTPGGRWYDYYTGELFSEITGTKKVAVTEESQIPLHVRGGYVIPMQEPANNTHYSRKNAFSLMVALDKEGGSANGELFWDDGEAIDTYENGNYFHALFMASENKLQMKISNKYTTDVDNLVLNEIHVLGVSTVNVVYVDGSNHTSFTYDSTTKVLKVTDLSLSIASEFTVEWRSQALPSASEYGRLDCCPEGCSEIQCANKGCLYSPSEAIRVPWCFIDVVNYGYTAEEVMSQDAVKEGNFTLSRKNTSSLYGGDIERIHVSMTQHKDALRIKMTDAADTRYEVPVGAHLNLPTGTGSDSGLSISLQRDPFSFKITRDVDNVDLFDTSIGGLTFADQFLQIAARIQCRSMQGLGEHIHPRLSHDFNYRTWPLFARDQPPGVDGNLYGVHPFYMCIEDSGKAHGVLLLNSHPMEVSTLPDPGVVFRTTGGILDLIIVNGDDPIQLLSSYASIVGTTFLPPYWALGFHLSRYGYNSLDNLRTVVERNIKAGIPYDVQHLDIDTMDERKDFTIDPVNFKDLPGFAKEIRVKGIRTFTILDPFLVSNYSDYEPYNRGLEKDVFIKWPPGVNPDFDEFQTDILLGWCWPKGRVVYPDFFHPNTSEYWQNLIKDFYRDGMIFDGIWLDMNEPANFGTNKDRAFNWPEKDTPYWTLKCPNSTWDDPPYKPKSIWGDRLSDKTICMNTLQARGDYRHYDVHNLYGWSQTEPTLLGVQSATNTRGMVVTRSTYPSSGRYAGHWLGDNNSGWSSMKESIIGIIEFNMFGIPYVGADICGYFNDAPVELCQRWQQLGAFYPFARNHQGKATQDQDPAYYGGEMLASTKRVLEIRYKLLPYLYTLFFKSHISGTPVVMGLSHVFNNDKEAASADRQFLWGSHLLISPVLEEKTEKIWAYFPTQDNTTTKWYDFYGGEMLIGGKYHEINAPMDTLPLHLREDSILVTQSPAANTELSRNNPFGLVLVGEVKSSFSFYWDDGESKDTIENGEYFESSIIVEDGDLIKWTVVKSHSSIGSGKLSEVIWYGVKGTPEGVIVNKNVTHNTFTYYSKHHALIISRLSIDMTVDFEIQVVMKTESIEGKCK